MEKQGNIEVTVGTSKEEEKNEGTVSGNTRGGKAKKWERMRKGHKVSKEVIGKERRSDHL